MEAVIIHAQREEEANEWKKELEAKISSRHNSYRLF